EPDFVFASFAVNVLTLVSLGALGLFCSTLARTVPGATTATYAVAVLFSLVTAAPGLRFVNPATLYGEWLTSGRGVGDGWLGPVLAYAAFHLTAAGLLVAAAARSLRARLLNVEKAVRAAAARWQPTGLGGDLMTLAQAAAPFLRQPVDALLPRAAAVRVFPPPPIGRNPLLWKELHFGGHATSGELLRSAGCLILLIEVMAVLALTAVFGFRDVDTATAREIRPFFASLLAALNGVLCLGVVVSAAG